MEKVFKWIDKIVTIVKDLCMEGKIQKQTYGEIRLSRVDMEDELNEFAITDPALGEPFSDMEQFVNEHINYADSGTLVEELHRRDFRIPDGRFVRKEGWRMTELDLEKAIKLLDDLDFERRLLEFALDPSVELNVILRSRERIGDVSIMNRILGDESIREIRWKIIAIIKHNIHNLESQIGKL